jgi:hypothetical protein
MISDSFAPAKPVPVFALLPSTEDHKGALRDFKTGTGFAYAKLSEVLPQVALLPSSG